MQFLDDEKTLKMRISIKHFSFIHPVMAQNIRIDYIKKILSLGEANMHQLSSSRT